MPWLLPVSHPAASFRNPTLLGPLTAHIENFVWIAKNGPPPRPRLERNPPVQRLRKLLKLCLKRKLPLSVDVETGRYGNIAAFAQLRVIGVGANIGPGWGLSWDWDFIPFKVKYLLRKALASPQLAKLWVNGKGYDHVVLRRNGFVLKGPQHDIKTGRRTVSSTSRVGLAFQAALYLPGCTAWKAAVLEQSPGDIDGDDEELNAMEDVKGYVSIGKVVRDKELDYNAEDCVRPAQIWPKQLAELKAGGARTKRIYLQLQRLEAVGSKMQAKGFYFDKEQARQLTRECLDIFRREKASLEKLIRKRAPGFRITDKGGVNENDLRALIYRDCAKPGIKSFNLEVPMSDKCWTKTGTPAVNKTALLYLYAMPDTPQEVREIMRVCWKVDAPLKLLGTYITSQKVRDAIGPDGHVHAGINVCATETYRWSCSKPNLFNLSEAIDEDAADLRGVLPNARRLYRAPPGFVLVHRDYKALELEVMAEYTGDALLRKMLDDPREDAHTARARAWFNLPFPKEVPKQIRKQAKVVGFASNYAAGVETVFMQVLHKIQDINFERVHALWTTFRRAHTGIVNHWERSLNFALERGYSEAPIMGYRRAYPDLTAVKDTETSNYAIQAGAAAIANATLVGIDPSDYYRSLDATLSREYPDAYLVCHVYDSFDVVCRPKDAEGVSQLMDSCMKGPWKIGPRLKEYRSDAKIGEQWSEV